MLGYFVAPSQKRGVVQLWLHFAARVGSICRYCNVTIGLDPTQIWSNCRYYSTPVEPFAFCLYVVFIVHINYS